MKDGDAFVMCAQGHRHWGVFGSAGLLVHHEGKVLLQHRSANSIGGDTWGVFGGARDRDESPVDAALRETTEESTLDVSVVTVDALMREDHGDWDYHTAIARVPELVDVAPASWESKGAAWVPVDEVETYDLFPPFATSWVRLRECLRRPVLVVDVANVMGSRADGWWRDRASAAARLRDEIAGVDGLTGMGPFDTAFPEKVLVVEGKARGVDAGDTSIRMVSAQHDGDDQIVATVKEIMRDPDVLCVVVTADRELKTRCRAEGAELAGPRWLLNQC